MHVCKIQCGATALILAAEKGLTECVRLLLEGGASVDFKGRVRGSLRCVAYRSSRGSHFMIGYCFCTYMRGDALLSISALVEHVCSHDLPCLILALASSMIVFLFVMAPQNLNSDIPMLSA